MSVMNAIASDFHADAIYQKRLDDLSVRLKTLRHMSNRYSNARFITFFSFLILGIVSITRGNTIAGIGAFVVGLGIFLPLVIRHGKIISAIDEAEKLVKINQAGLSRVDGTWRKFADSGEEFLDPDHVYSKDLDIFGQGSLFQWLNATGTFRGRRKFAALVSNARFDSVEATANHAAIEELAAILDWRQGFACQAFGSDAYRRDPGAIVTWMKSDAYVFTSKAERCFFRLLPLIVPSLTVLFFLTTGNPYSFAFWIPLNILLLLIRRKSILRLLSQFERHEAAIKVYANLLSCIEKQEFTSEKLRIAREGLFLKKSQGASQAIDRLGSKVAFSQSRNGMMGPVFNILFFLDAQSALSLESWKRVYGRHVESWIEAIAMIETFSSLATIRHDNPDWCFATFCSDGCYFTAQDAGHPLIDARKRVSNNVELGGSGSVIMITGSNMSGKTTLLRTVGINLVLAYAGAPVCARELTCSTGQLLTSMRITDDLQNGISTFYAELLRIRKILDGLRGGPSIVLIDEIFRGTNTHDRHQAAQSVLAHLAKQNAITVISTHDLDLADLEAKDPAHFRNFHFEDTYGNKSIHFDYILRPGRSTSSNAMHLLELVGIAVEKNCQTS